MVRTTDLKKSFTKYHNMNDKCDKLLKIVGDWVILSNDQSNISNKIKILVEFDDFSRDVMDFLDEIIKV